MTRNNLYAEGHRGARRDRLEFFFTQPVDAGGFPLRLLVPDYENAE